LASLACWWGERGGARGYAARCANLGGLAKAEKATFREHWEVMVGYARSRAECGFSSFKRALDGHVAACKWVNVVNEVVRKIAIYTGGQKSAPRSTAFLHTFADQNSA